MKKYFFLFLSALPAVTFAAGSSSVTDKTLDTMLSAIDQNIVNPLIYLLFGVALVIFLWGVIQFIMNADNEEGRSVGRQHILWGIVGMFIMFSAFGILTIVLNSFEISPNVVNQIRQQH